MKNYLLFLLLFVPAYVWADIQISPMWTPATIYTDGTPMAANEIAEFRLYYTFNNDLKNKKSYFKIDGTKRSEMFTLSIPANTAPIFSLWYAMTTVSIEGGESDLSNVISAKYEYKPVSKVPGTPTLVNVKVTCDPQCTVQLAK